jgi:penicillin-binding protein 2
MRQHKFLFRVWTGILLVLLVFGIYILRLYDLQIVQSKAEGVDPPGTYTYRTRVKAARGEIIDRNGNVLVGNRASFNLVLINDALFNSPNYNESIRRLTNMTHELGLEITDHFPVTMDKPYTYTKNEYSNAYNSYFKSFLAARQWDADITAPQLIRRMRSLYGIPEDWTEEEIRRVLSVRYELSLRRCTNLPTYVLLEDVDAPSLAALNDLNIPGLNVETSTVREYHTDYAAHILGRTGLMNAEEYELYKQYGYSMDAYVGKDGLEKAFELQLHGTDGMRETKVAADGTILEEHYIQAPIAGNHVELSIDINLQRIAEEEMERLVRDLKENGLKGSNMGMDCEGGAVVAMQVKTGEVLVCSSYPSYSLQTYYEDYNELMEMKPAPFYNRALSATYPPGSVFKMVTTIAGIEQGRISSGTRIEDKGIYRRFEDSNFFPRCMLWTTQRKTHGSINVMEALACSCNYYFYEVGWKAGIDSLDRVAAALGLGEYTGIEIKENKGRRANPDTKKENYSGSDAYWYGADTVLAAIGQSENRFTPMQLCNYTCALANRGTRYRATFMNRVISSDYQSLIQENQPEVVAQLNIPDDAYYAIVEGMHMTTTWGAGTSYGLYHNYPIAVCTKSGTAQHGSGGSDHASFVIFAPKDDPQIAIAIYLQKGGQGGNLGKVAQSILDSYFSETGSVDTVPGENIIG